MTTPETRYARTTDGTHVAYQVHGDGPTDIVVLRAWHSNLDHEWRDPVLAGIYRRLGAVGRVVRLDRRGTGLSDRLDPGRLPTIEDRLDDMRAVLDAVRSEQAVMIGLAHGTALCAVFAATYPNRTAGLVMYSPPLMLVGQADPEVLREFGREMTAAWGTTEGVRTGLARAAQSRIEDPDFVEWVRRDQVESGSGADAAAQWALISRTNIDGILSTIHVPTLVLWRTGSPNAGPYVAARVPTAASAELPGTDHVMISGDWRPWLAAVEEFIEGLEPAGPDADRILATVLFTDIVGSTERAANAGDAAWRDLVERHHAVVRRELARHRGREIDTAGDGFFAAFDAPARAIRCAVATRQAVADLGLTLRIGVHVGECERTDDGGLRGVAVHAGARISATAAPGEIVVSGVVRDLVAGSGIEFSDAGVHELKGVPGEWPLFRVVSA